MNRNGDKAHAPGLSALLRREMRSDINKSYLRGLPAFRSENELPDRLRDLLGRLDRVEPQQR